MVIKGLLVYENTLTGLPPNMEIAATFSLDSRVTCKAANGLPRSKYYRRGIK